MSYKITRNGLTYHCERIAIEDRLEPYGRSFAATLHRDLRLTGITNPPGIREIVIPIETGDSIHIEKEAS